MPGKTMFTGIVQTVAKVVSLKGGRLVLQDPAVWDADDPWKLGDSVAVNGCCLTVVSFEDGLHFDLSEETIARTSFAEIGAGSVVNMERPMRMSDRFGGHIVQGHVDATGKLASITKNPDSWTFRFSVPAEDERYLIDKGSISVDGVSLTVCVPKGWEFDVAVIPHTFEVTNFGRMKVGDLVNLEFDAIAKHVEKLMEFYRTRP